MLYGYFYSFRFIIIIFFYIMIVIIFSVIPSVEIIRFFYWSSYGSICRGIFSVAVLGRNNISFDFLNALVYWFLDESLAAFFHVAESVKAVAISKPSAFWPFNLLQGWKKKLPIQSYNHSFQAITNNDIFVATKVILCITCNVTVTQQHLDIWSRSRWVRGQGVDHEARRETKRGDAVVKTGGKSHRFMREEGRLLA